MAATRCRRVLVKVRWAGVDDDGDPWTDSWVGLSMLTVDLRLEVMRLLKRLGTTSQAPLPPLRTCTTEAPWALSSLRHSSAGRRPFTSAGTAAR